MKRLLAPFIAVLFFIFLVVFSPEIVWLFAKTDTDAAIKLFQKLMISGCSFAITWFLLRIVMLLSDSYCAVRGLHFPKLLKSVLSIIVYGVTLGLVLSLIFDRPLTGLFATSSVVGIVVGFATKNLISDAFSGIAIHMEKPFSAGDWLLLPDGTEAQVTEITWRSTRLVSCDDFEIVVPNSVLGEQVLKIFSKPKPYFRLRKFITLDFSVPTDRAIRVLQAGLLAGQRPIPDRQPRVLIKQTTERGVEYELRFFIPDYDVWASSQHKIMESVMHHLYQAGISPSHSKQDLYYSEMPSRLLNREKDLATLLRRIDLFGSLSDLHVENLVPKLKEHMLPMGVTIVQQDDRGDSLYIVLEGLLKASILSDKDEVDVGFVESGQFFGEMSLLTGEPRSATISSLTSVVLYEVTKDHLLPLIKSIPELAQSMAQIVAHRKLKSDEAFAAKALEQQIKETKNLALELLQKMSKFFGHLMETMLTRNKSD